MMRLNLISVFADRLGYASLGYTRNTYAKTPNIGALYAKSVDICATVSQTRSSSRSPCFLRIQPFWEKTSAVSFNRARIGRLWGQSSSQAPHWVQSSGLPLMGV